jgi:cytidine deaminase
MATDVTDITDMLVAANAARVNAYAPYSNFAVGACLRGRSGRLYAGCNVENAAYPQGQCAEATAIGVMVAAGETAIAEILVVADGPEPITPCGGCRQRLREFAGPDVPVYLCSPDGLRRTVTLGELLPLSFGSAHIG